MYPSFAFCGGGRPAARQWRPSLLQIGVTDKNHHTRPMSGRAILTTGGVPNPTKIRPRSATTHSFTKTPHSHHENTERADHGSPAYPHDSTQPITAPTRPPLCSPRLRVKPTPPLLIQKRPQQPIRAKQGWSRFHKPRFIRQEGNPGCANPTAQRALTWAHDHQLPVSAALRGEEFHEVLPQRRAWRCVQWPHQQRRREGQTLQFRQQPPPLPRHIHQQKDQNPLLAPSRRRAPACDPRPSRGV